MEFLLVQFAESRGVLLDGMGIGLTNQVLEVEGGVHTVTLDPPKDFSPGSQDVTLQDTTVISPATVEFQKITPQASAAATGGL